MHDVRVKAKSARHRGRGKGAKMPIGAFWIDFHRTAVERLPDTLKRAAEEALGRSIPETAEQVETMVENARRILDLSSIGRECESRERWIEANMVAFAKYGCNASIAERISELVCAESNYVATPERLEFIRWLLNVFPCKHALTASNAKFATITQFLRDHGFNSVAAVSGDLLNVYKPSQEFFERLIEVTEVPPQNTLFVCNSPRNDLLAARLGVNVVIILPSSVIESSKQITERVGGLIGQVHITRSLEEAKTVIKRNFVNAR